MTHVFVAPHPDDVALSCGGLIASLRELGQNVSILTVFSGTGGTDRLTPYQREALGFGTKTVWPVSEAFNRAHLQADFPEDASAAPWAATPEGLNATQADADAAATRSPAASPLGCTSRWGSAGTWTTSWRATWGSRSWPTSRRGRCRSRRTS